MSRWCAPNRLRRGRPDPDAGRDPDDGAATSCCLRDQANLALGFAYLQADQPTQARVRTRAGAPERRRIRAGRCSATAGRDAALGDYRAALAPWLELRKRNLLDAAVQESYLAVPYAYGKLNADAQSAEYYETALSSYADESDALDAAIGRIRDGHMLDDLLGDEQERALSAGSGSSRICPTRPSRAICTRCWPDTISRRVSRTIAT